MYGSRRPFNETVTVQVGASCLNVRFWAAHSTRFLPGKSVVSGLSIEEEEVPGTHLRRERTRTESAEDLGDSIVRQLLESTTRELPDSNLLPDVEQRAHCP